MSTTNPESTIFIIIFFFKGLQIGSFIKINSDKEWELEKETKVNSEFL